MDKDEQIKQLQIALGAINHMIVGRWLAIDLTAAIKKISFDALQNLPSDTDIETRVREYKEIQAKAIKAVHESFGEPS